MRTPAISLGLAYLQAELTRVDVLIRRYADQRGVFGAGLNPPAPAGAGEPPLFDRVAHALLRAPLGAQWAMGGMGVPLPAGEDRWADPLARAAQQSLQIAEGERSRGRTPRLLHAAAVLGLAPLELDLLLLAIAPALDNRYGALYAYLADDALLRQPTVELALAILSGPGLLRERWQHHFDADASLFRHRLLRWGVAPDPAATPLAGRTFFVDPAFVTWLLGGYEAPIHLRGVLALAEPEPDSADEMLAGEVWPRLVAALHGQSLVALHGPDREAQVAVARRLALQERRPLLDMDVAGSARAGVPPLDALRLVLRDALLTDALVHLAGLDAWLEEDALPRPLLEALDIHAGPLVASSRVRWQTQGVARQRPILWLEVPMPSGEHRRTLWRHYLAGWTDLDALDIDGLAGQFALTGGDIRDVAALAWDRAVQRGDGVTTADLYAAARTHSSSRLGLLAQKIPPSYEWDDLILPADQMAALREAVATVRGRRRVFDEWGVGRKLAASEAVTMLFTGSPGTGKTMAAGVIARELGLDLYRIDLSSLVSKYIGETEKNLERIFVDAEQSNAILFFDEADAVFGKRSEVHDSHDRYANIGISYLLQRMEAYNGVTILATNLSANLDEAFVRRLHFVINFPFPGVEDRLRMWQRLFPEDVPREPGLDFAPLARLLAVSGGHIRNIIVAATFLAAEEGRPVAMSHLSHAARRELQKMGRIGALEELNADDALAIAVAGDAGSSVAVDAPSHPPESPAGEQPADGQGGESRDRRAPRRPAARSAARSAEAPAPADALTRVDQALAGSGLRAEDRAVIEPLRAGLSQTLANAAPGGKESALACARLATLADAAETLAHMRAALIGGRQLLDSGTLDVQRRSSLSTLLRRAAAERDALLRLFADAPLERADVVHAVRVLDLRASSVDNAL